MARVAVLGGGMVGRAIVADLSTDCDVRVADIDDARVRDLAARYGVEGVAADVADEAGLRRQVGDCDLVVCAVPGFMGFETLRRVIDSGTDVVDISFFAQDPLELDELARRRGVTAVVDFGVAPGTSNLIVGFHDAAMTVRSFDCIVGGLPVARHRPWEYKAPFSPVDVIEEYTRPARLRVGGELITRPALSEIEQVEIEGVGTLEAFNTDGLRTLLQTTGIPDLRERTLRYPGHAALMRILRDGGFFGAEPIDAGGVRVRPLDVTAALLLPAWRPAPREDEFTVMHIRIAGEESGEPRTYEYRLLDRYDRESGLSSMARTTGFAATAAARLVLDGTYAVPGVSPPERVGAAPGCCRRVLDELGERGVVYDRRVL